MRSDRMSGARRARDNSLAGVLLGVSRKANGQTCEVPSTSSHSAPALVTWTQVRKRATVGDGTGPAGDGELLRVRGAIALTERNLDEEGVGNTRLKKKKRKGKKGEKRGEERGAKEENKRDKERKLKKRRKGCRSA